LRFDWALFENPVFTAVDLRVGRRSAETPTATGVFKQSLGGKSRMKILNGLREKSVVPLPS